MLKTESEGSLEERLARIAELTLELRKTKLEADPADVKAFPLDDADVVIAGYPKSGTNWLQVMVANLWDGWGGLVDGKVPNMASKGRENHAGFTATAAGTPPRLMKVHLSRLDMPDRWPEHGKVIQITRNPKDVCVSFFHELKNLPVSAPEMGEVGGFDDMSFHVQRFVRGYVPWGGYLDNIISWRTFDHPNLLKITYEDARRDTRSTIERIIEFLGRPVPEDRITTVIEKTEFDAMRTNELRHQINHPNLREGTDTPFMRKGLVGDWKEALSAADSELIDALVVGPLEEHGIHLTYE